MEKKLDKIKRKVLRKYPAFNILTANLEIKVNDSVFPSSVQSCMTNGKDIYVHSKFLNEQSEDVLVFAIAHELGHIAFNHVKRIEGKDSKLWNYACDAVLNQLLSNDGLDIPSFAIDKKEAASYSVDEYYNKLLEKQKEQEKKEQKQNNQDNESNNGNSDDQQKESNENNKDDSNKEDMNYGHDMWKTKNCKQDKNQDIDEQKEFKKNKKQRLQNTNEMLKKMSDEAKNNDEGVIQEIDTLGYSKPLIDWRYLFREAVESNMDWSYSNAEFENGVLTPQLMYYSEPTCEILLDTSGSISKKLLKNFLLECKNILQTSKVKVGFFDIRFYGWQIINSIEEIENMKFRGGQGTSFDVSINAFTPRADNKIIFTDGDAVMPNVRTDIIWVILGDIKINPIGGKVIYVDENKLNNKSYIRTK